MLRNFLYRACGSAGDWSIRSFIDDDLETPTFLRKQMD